MQDKMELETFWSPDPIIAYRTFDKGRKVRFKRSYEPLTLSDISYFKGETYSAICHERHFCELRFSQGPIPHVKPHPVYYVGTCGFYGFKNLSLLNEHSMSPLFYFTVAAKVEFSGRVIEHEFGYRAEKMKIISILKGREKGKWRE